MLQRLCGHLHLQTTVHHHPLLHGRLLSSSGGGTSVPGPLTGLRVLDLTRVLAGPFCTMLLGDLGAEVIKVEKPGFGDDTRTWGPPFMNSETVYFMSINRNKKSMTVNLKTGGGQEIIQKLAAKSDILVENYIPGKLESFGLGYSSLNKVNPRLIYCSITGFGETGPYADRAGYDVIVSAIAGLMHITGPRGGDPVRVGVAMTDLSTGLYAYGSIMAALLHRHQTGMGQWIQCNLLSSQVALLTSLACNFLNAGIEAERWGTAHQSIVPYQAFRTSDGWIVVGAGNDSHFQALCERIGLPELSKEDKYSSNEKRVKHRDLLISILSERPLSLVTMGVRLLVALNLVVEMIEEKKYKFAEYPTTHWLEVLEGCGFPYGPINNLSQVFSDSQIQHLEIVQSVLHPTAGQVKFPGPAVFYSNFSQPVRLPPPVLGQHTRDILENLLGYDDGEISKLMKGNCISQSL